MNRIILICLLFTLPLSAFPEIPASTRILTVREVQNFWQQAIRNEPIPPKPTGLHPEQRRAWLAGVEGRATLVKQLGEGAYRHEAQLAALRHNIAAYEKLENLPAAQKLAAELRALELHDAQLQLTAAQITAANAVREAAIAAEAAANRTGYNSSYESCR